jgi:hypothetical protein
MTRRPAGRTRWFTTALFTAGLLVLGVIVAGPANAAGAYGTGVVATGSAQIGLNVRMVPGTHAPIHSSLPDGTQFTIICQQKAQLITGTVRTTDLWNKLSTGLWVSDAYVRRSAAPIPACTRPAAPARNATVMTPAQGWVSPIGGTVGSGFRTKERPTHDGVDIAAARNTPIHAAAAGKVITVLCNASTNNCDVDGGPTVKGCGWYVEIQHADKVVTRYCHLIRRPPVKEDQSVTAGQVIGHVGSSGHSTGPHLHFEVHTSAAPANSTNAVDPVTFLQSKGVTTTA